MPLAQVHFSHMDITFLCSSQYYSVFHFVLMYEICDVVHKIYKMFLMSLIRCGASRDKDTSLRAEMIQLQWKINAYFVSFMSLLHLDMMKKETDEEN